MNKYACGQNVFDEGLAVHFSFILLRFLLFEQCITVVFSLLDFQFAIRENV
jgi:hypothetical protein